MGKSSGTSPEKYGVSIVACTKRPDYMNNLFSNYSRQLLAEKELIIILNNDAMDLVIYREQAKKHKNVQVYQLPESRSLGHCLNFGVTKAKYGCLAKFDDDDYYAPEYLTESLQAMIESGADVVGKRAHFMYLEGAGVLLLRYFRQEKGFVSVIQGATLLIKREVFDKVTFSDRNRGESVRFCSDCRAKGFKIFACGRNNYAAIRRRNSKGHTWIVSDKALLSGTALTFQVENFKEYVTRPREQQKMIKPITWVNPSYFRNPHPPFLNKTLIATK